MLMTAVVLPEAFAAACFVDPTYHLNAEILLRGIDANGLILIDAEERLYNELCDQVETLANVGKGKTTHALFEELLKKKRQKIMRFVKTACSFNKARPTVDLATTVAIKCRADSLVVDPASREVIVSGVPAPTQVIAVPEYISSFVESERRRYCESLSSVDQMPTGEFDRLIERSFRFSRWIRFYDKQIGKGNNLSHFRRGIERILRVWIQATSYPKDQLRAELFTVVDESPYKSFAPSVAFNRVKGDLIEPLQQQFGVTFTFAFKRDNESICHARHLQTSSTAILFEGGFDFLENDGTFRRVFIKLDGGCSAHLKQYRDLPAYTPAT